ncbi:agmatine deiminase family protein [bacterium]|nr:agmatine deiminase family protein [bacterium]
MPTRGAKADAPPVAPVRNVAEWEPATGVLIRYPLGLPYDLLTDLDDDVTLHVVVSSGYQSAAQSNLAANGVDMARVEFLVRANDSIWTRDYGPWYVFDGTGTLTIIDHTYNRPWRPNDNLIPIYFAQQQGLPVISHDMYHTGGNYMTDGAGVGMSTDLVIDEAWSENGMSAAEVDQLMSDYYGISTYYTLEYIESGGIHHIDTWAKFLDEETILLKEVWAAHHTYDELEQRAVLLASLTASTGRNYQVSRVYCYDIGGGDPASYTNSLFLNDRIYVPFFGNAAYDQAAIAAYQAAAPGYQVEGYYYSGFLSDDALHCRAKGVYDRGMLRVGHVPIREASEGPVAVTSFVDDRSEAGLDFVRLVYRFAGEGWTTVEMTALGDDLYKGVIPAPLFDTTVEYYVLAADLAGRSEGMPRTAPGHWYGFPILRQTTDVSGPPAAARLLPNRPNPFNPSTTFSFELRDPAPARLTVADARGREVRRLLDGEMCPAGLTRVRWDGRDSRGRMLPSGVYHFTLEVAGLRYSRPATLVR